VIKKLYHITFPVSDLKRTATFYENVLGLKKTSEWPNYTEFDVGGVHFGLKPSGKLEVFLLVDDIDKAYQDLRGKGVKFVTEPRDQPWGVNSTLHRPWGKRVHPRVIQMQSLLKNLPEVILN
jgi:catechol 2,3-dioxygenase-like lactoylglutathione lyase family enzyme